MFVMLNWISHSPSPRPLVMNSKSYHCASWTSHVKMLRIQNLEPPNHKETLSKPLSSPACGWRLYPCLPGLPEGKSNASQSRIFKCPQKPRPGGLAPLLSSLVIANGGSVVRDSGFYPAYLNLTSSFCRGLLPTPQKGCVALKSCTCVSEHPYTLMTNYFTFILELQFKDWIRLRTSRSRRSLINNLIHLLACSQGSQVSKNWVNLPIDSIFQCLRACLILLSYKDNMLLKKSLPQWDKEAIV